MSRERKLPVDTLIEEKVGSLAELENIPLPEKLSLLLPNGGLLSLAEGTLLGTEGKVIITRGLSDPSIHTVAERCGTGYELFIVSREGSADWAVHMLSYLMEWELTAKIDLFGRIMEMGEVTIENLPLHHDNPALNSVLITSPWEAKSSEDGQIMLLAVTLIFEDEMRWALRYGRDHLSTLLKESGIGIASDRRRHSVLTIPASNERLTALQMQGWYRKLNESGIPQYILEEVMNQYVDDWDSIVLRVDNSQNSQLLIARSTSLHGSHGEVAVEWREGDPPPRFGDHLLDDFPAAVAELANLMGIVAARPGTLEDGVWKQVEMRISKNNEGRYKLDWEFGYPQ
ncbi:MAG: suppressor of fused domain protein [Blastocatellia bacterium]|nr:suppressor of fused domain protein [Blastocatellia bacterium]